MNRIDHPSRPDDLPQQPDLQLQRVIDRYTDPDSPVMRELIALGVPAKSLSPAARARFEVAMEAYGERQLDCDRQGASTRNAMSGITELGDFSAFEQLIPKRVPLIRLPGISEAELLAWDTERPDEAQH